jgi:Fungalysin metallopeptidase (M36)/Secretion system C-terminal sorting domain/PA domain
MKKIIFLFCFTSTFIGFSQTPIENIKSFISENRSKFNLTNDDISDLVITNDFSTADNDVFIYHVRQRANGIQIYNSDSNFLLKNGSVINEAGKNFISNINQKINISNPNLSVIIAYTAAINNLNNQAAVNTAIIERTGNRYKLKNGNLIEYPINAELLYFNTNQNGIRLVWDYEFYTQDLNHLWHIMVDAVDGKVLFKEDLVLSCYFEKSATNSVANSNANLFSQNFIKTQNQHTFSPGTTNYKVIKWNFESPNHTSRTVETNPEFTTNASPNGWHNASTTVGGSTSTLLYNYTRGNNVFAYSDYSNDNPTAPTTFTNASSGTYPNLTFDYTYGGNSVDATTYIDAATTNLFYMNNVMHDLWYQYGFTESNKNFQAANFARGGAGNDAVNAEAQDASLGNNNPGAGETNAAKFNNANFATPSDGSKPRMQMYLWNAKKTSSFTVNSGSLAGANISFNDNVFTEGHVDLPIAPLNITNNLVLLDDGTTDNTDACTPAINASALNGKIAVVRRGGCNFIIKVKIAQDAGAIAVIVVNNTTGAISMTGADASVTIPAISISQTDGENIITSMSSGTVSVSLSLSELFVNTDGDFDNGIIAHEYGHGISTRLSGNCLGGSEQMGEGWSDWFWLMMQIKPGDTRNMARGIGTFAQNQLTSGQGIRQYRYSTDLAVNPHTYGNTNTQLNGTAINRHGVGSIWAVTLWDLAWNYIDKYGFDPNLYTGNGGNNKVMKLVLDAIKIDGCNPTMITGRDALIQADQITTGGQNYCLIWSTFARRGLGTGASAGNNSGTVADIQDQVEDFTQPAPGPNCTTLGLNYFENEDLVAVYPNPSTGLINIKINKFNGKINLQVVDLNGRVVYSLKQVTFNIEKTIDLHDLQSGLYIVKIEGENLKYTKKIILN